MSQNARHEHGHPQSARGLANRLRLCRTRRQGYGHRRFRHESGVVITVPSHGKQNLSQKHDGMIVRQLEATGFDRDTVRRDLNAQQPPALN